MPIACNQLAALLLGIVGLKLISQYVPADVNGTYGLFLTLTQIGALVTHSGLVILNLSAGFALHGCLVIGAIVLLFRWSVQSPNPSDETRSQWLKELREYGRPFLWLGIGNWLLQSADRWVVAHFFGDRPAGFFTYVSGIGAVIPTMVVGGLMQWIFPTIFRKADEARSRQDWQALAKTCDRVTLAFLCLTLVGLFLLTWIRPHLLGWLISPQYADALEMLIPAGCAMVTVQVNQFYYLLLQGQHNSAGMVRVMMLVSGLKTFGRILAASISWPAFWWWLVVSLVLGSLLGRHLIRRMALHAEAIPRDTAN